MRSLFTTCVAVLVLSVLAGCAAEVPRAATQFTPVKAGQTAETIVLRRDTLVRPSIGYDRVLKARSAWIAVGTVSAGKVYRPDGFTLTIRSANTHEAYLVVRDGQLVGFYLPGEQGYAPVLSPVPLLLEIQ
ncbi:MAG: hypothetical protein IPK34_07460 [Ramlibacter sp.]|jgi:hypothetical protein|nr:hypothetical protein [Ramlibacter sp.]